MNNSTFHSVFQLPINVLEKLKASDEHLQVLRKRYQYLKAVLIDEVSIIDNGAFDCLSRWLRAINRKVTFTLRQYLFKHFVTSFNFL